MKRLTMWLSHMATQTSLQLAVLMILEYGTPRPDRNCSESKSQDSSVTVFSSRETVKPFSLDGVMERSELSYLSLENSYSLSTMPIITE
jgi:hypothetical protein